MIQEVLSSQHGSTQSGSAVEARKYVDQVEATESRIEFICLFVFVFQLREFSIENETLRVNLDVMSETQQELTIEISESKDKYNTLLCAFQVRNFSNLRIFLIHYDSYES